MTAVFARTVRSRLVWYKLIGDAGFLCRWQRGLSGVPVGVGSSQKGAGRNGRAQGRPSLSFSWQWDFGEGKRASTEMVVVLAAVMVVPAVAPEHRSGRSRAGSAAASTLQSVQGTVPVLAGSWK